MTRVGLLILLTASSSAAAELRVGAAAVAITPPLGAPLAGYYSERGADGVRDDLFAKALVLDKDGAKAALVTLDLISTTRAHVVAARRLIEKETGIPAGHVLISASHTHTGPELGGRGPRSEALGGLSDLTRRYSEELPARIAEAVRRADKALAPALVARGRGHEENIAFNRRFHMADGSVGWNPGLLNAKILKPAGPVDTEVSFVAFASPQKKPVATYVNYAVHLDNVGGTHISADMPATVARLLGDVLGPDAVTLYATGCCGDVNHINVSWGEPQKGPGQAARMGVLLTAEVLRVWPQRKPVEASALRCKSEIVPLPLPKVTAEEVEKARATAARFRETKGQGIPFLESVNAFKVLDIAAREGRPHEVEVQVVALGRDVAWVGLPGEIFAELGLAVKQDSPFPQTLIAELANGSVGYVPARRAYAQGNYEVVSTRCAAGAGELLVEAAVRILKDIYKTDR